MFSRRNFFNKPLKILLITNALILLAAAMLGPIYSLFVEEIGGSLLDASLAGGIFALTAGIVTLISGKYSDKVKENELIVVLGYVFMGIGFLLYTVVNSIWFLFLVQVIIGLGEAIYSPAFDAVYSKHLTKRKSGKQWGIYEAATYFTAAIGAVIGGFIVTYLGFNVIFVLMGVLCLGSALYIYQLPRKAL
ncbi:MFS transporter [Patescibacteria group bacterium]|nr:MFS transporter [Patescibacteria group bacterium]